MSIIKMSEEGQFMCHDPCTDTERFCCPSHIMFTKPTRTNNEVIHTRDQYTSVRPTNLR